MTVVETRDRRQAIKPADSKPQAGLSGTARRKQSRPRILALMVEADGDLGVLGEGLGDLLQLPGGLVEGATAGLRATPLEQRHRTHRGLSPRMRQSS